MLSFWDKIKPIQGATHVSTQKKRPSSVPTLKVSSMVVELEIAPKSKPETDAREVQCEIIDHNFCKDKKQPVIRKLL